jgi:hypothetical protein
MAKKASTNNRAEEALVSTYTDDWRRLGSQKIRRAGGVEARVLTSLCMVFGEHFVMQNGFSLTGRKMTDEDKNKLWLVFNMIGRATWRKIGRLWSIDNKFRAVPNTLDPAAWDQADVVSKLILALNRKVKEGQKHWNRLFWLLVGGVVIEHTPWLEEVSGEAMPEFLPDGPNGEPGEMVWIDQWEGDKPVPQSFVQQSVLAGVPQERFKPKEIVQMVGDVGSELFTPLDFFIDASCKSIRDLSGDQACYLAQLKTKGWIADNFGNEIADKVQYGGKLNIVRTILSSNDNAPVVSGMNLQDLIPAIQGTSMPGDPEMAIVLTRYSPRSTANPHGSRCMFVPDSAILDKGDIADFAEIPCTDMHWRPNATSFWTPDFITDMVAGQKFLNKRMSQLGEASNAQIYEMLLLGGDLKREDIPTDYHGVVPGGLDDAGNPLVRVMERGQLPSFFPQTIDIALGLIDTLGSSDLLSQRKFPGQLRGPMAIPMLQELLDSEDGPVYTHMGEQLADIHQKRVNLVKRFYEPVRTLHYTGANLKDEVLIFNKSLVLKDGWDYQISVDRASLLPELSSLREARVRERLEGPLAALYMNRRTGKIDISKIADDLKYHDTNREDRESQYRKLAREFIIVLQRGEQLDPHLPLPFYDHDVIMDELEAVMATTEWLRASQLVKHGFVDLYNKCQQFLQQLHDSQQNIMESKMMQNAVAMATQQAAAKAAATATEAAITQVDLQRDQAQGGNGQPSLTDVMDQLLKTQGGPKRPM